MRTRDILYKARNIINNGWAKFTLETPDGRCCALGAINKAQTGSGLLAGSRSFEATNYVKDCIGNEGEFYCSLSSFNDTRETKEEVIAVFDKAIAKLNGRKYKETK